MQEVVLRVTQWLDFYYVKWLVSLRNNSIEQKPRADEKSDLIWASRSAQVIGEYDRRCSTRSR